MYSKWRLALKYIQYYLRASNGKGHGIHSPFIFHFITRILNDKKEYTAYKKVEALRNTLVNNKQVLRVDDFGAGSVTGKNDERTIGAIARSAAKPARYGQLLFRMVKTYQPATIIELGSSLGLTTAYLALAKPGAAVTTLEGAGQVADQAAIHFRELGIENVTIRKGNFDETFPGVISATHIIDFAFIDGNHRQEPTERYFNALLPKVSNDTILVFDDIHWSKEMEAAWQTIRKHPQVRCTVDLFFIGIVFFRKEFLAKEHFTIRF